MQIVLRQILLDKFSYTQLDMFSALLVLIIIEHPFAIPHHIAHQRQFKGFQRRAGHPYDLIQ